jgi:septal ring-binding cell division protein DamX
MAKQRKRAPEPDWKHLVSAGALVTGVLGTLLLGAVLQAEPDDPSLQAGSTIPTPTPEVGFTAGEERPSEGLSDTEDTTDESSSSNPFTGDADLVDRAAADERRLSASGHGYTLQFAVNCEPKNVRANLNALRSEQDFYLLTMLYQDRACFRLCWGFYDSEQQARAARDVPQTLRAMTTTPKALSIAEALP